MTDIWDIVEKYLETPLFRDANIPEVNKLLIEFVNEVEALKRDEPSGISGQLPVDISESTS